jgi:hypothetical protein
MPTRPLPGSGCTAGAAASSAFSRLLEQGPVVLSFSWGDCSFCVLELEALAGSPSGNREFWRSGGRALAGGCSPAVLPGRQRRPTPSRTAGLPDAKSPRAIASASPCRRNSAPLIWRLVIPAQPREGGRADRTPASATSTPSTNPKPSGARPRQYGCTREKPQKFPVRREKRAALPSPSFPTHCDYCIVRGNSRRETREMIRENRETKFPIIRINREFGERQLRGAIEMDVIIAILYDSHADLSMTANGAPGSCRKLGRCRSPPPTSSTAPGSSFSLTSIPIT